MMTLCQVLPLIIADKIPEDNENWHSFVVLLKICSIAVTPVCQCIVLKFLIEENLLFSVREQSSSIPCGEHDS